MSNIAQMQPNCHTWGLEEFWNNNRAESLVITSLKYGARGSVDPWQCPRVSVHCPEQNNREHFIYSVCQPVQLEGSAVGRPSDSAG